LCKTRIKLIRQEIGKVPEFDGDILTRIRLPLAFILLIALSPSWFCLYSENKKTKKPDAQENKSVFRLPVNVIVVNATVTDKAGNPVTDLAADDFRLYDDGRLQKIQTFALEFSGPAEFNGEIKASTASSMPRPVKQNAVTSRPRLVSIVIDDLTMYTPLHFAEIVKAVKEFIKNDTGPTDRVAILSGSRKVQLPFSDNKQHLLEEVDAVLGKLNPNWNFRFSATDVEAQMDATVIPNSSLTDRAAWGIANYEPQYMDAGPWLRTAAKLQNDEAEFRTYNLLYTIRQHLRALSHFDGAKSVVLFSDGIIAQPATPAAFQLQELIELALHSGIALNTVSIRGAPTHVGGISVDNGIIDNLMKNEDDEADKLAQEGVLAQMASETGGRFFFAGSNMYKGLRDVANHQSYYYVLSYSIPPHEADGAYHKIKLELTRPGLELSYRKGYYAPKEELTFENRKKEDLMAALSGPGNMKEIPMTLSYNYFQEDDSTYSVSFVTNVNIQGLRFVEESARRKNQVSLVLVAFDENDHYISGLEKAIDFRLMENSYASLRQHGLTSRVQLKLTMGRYKIKAVVREENQGKIGSITKAVEIP
jgi:VWFA-related protein